MGSPKDITNCFAFDKKIKKKSSHQPNAFSKVAYGLFFVVFVAQFILFLFTWLHIEDLVAKC